MALAAALFEKIVVYAIFIIIGFFAVRLHVMTFEDSKVLSRFALYFLTPCAMFDAFQYEFSMDRLTGMGIAAAGVLLCVLAFALLERLLARRFKLSVVEYTSLEYPNSGNFMLPLVASVMGGDWVIYCCPCFLIICFLLFSHCKAVLSGEKRIRADMFYKNSVIIALVLGLVLFLLNIQITGLAGDAISSLGSMMGPTYMFTVGMIIGNADLKKIFSNKRAYIICAGRLILCPLLAMAVFFVTGLLRIHPDAPRFLLVVFLTAGAPTAVTITQFTQLYRSVPEAEFASVINILSTILCLVTMPCMAYLYQLAAF